MPTSSIGPSRPSTYAAVVAEGRDPQVRHGDQGRAGRDQRAYAEPLDQPRGDPRGGEDQQGQRQEREAGAEGAVPEHALHELHGEEEERELRSDEQRHHRDRTDAHPAAQQLRSGAAGQPYAAGGRRTSRAARPRRRTRRACRPEVQPWSGALMKPNTRLAEPSVAMTAPATSKRARWRSVSATSRRTSEQHDDAERDVDQQRPAPRGVAGQHAAEQQADRGAGRGDRAEQGERLVAGGRVRCRGGEQRQHARGRNGGADALERPGRDQQLGGGGQPTEEGGRGEHGQAGHERATTTEDVAEAAAEEQQSAEGQGVAVQHPRQGRGGEAEVAADVGEGDVHDSHVEDEHELDGEDERQSEGALHLR